MKKIYITYGAHEPLGDAKSEVSKSLALLKFDEKIRKIAVWIFTKAFKLLRRKTDWNLNENTASARKG